MVLERESHHSNSLIGPRDIAMESQDRRRQRMQYQPGRPLEQWVKEYENDPEFIAEGLATDVMEEATVILGDLELTQSSLADLMGVSRSHVSRIFNAPPNLTLRSIARLAVALNVKPVIILDESSYFVWPVNQPNPFTREDYEIAREEYLRNKTDAQSTVNTGVGRPGIGVLTNATA